MLAALPNILPKNQVTLGLDLRGGSHIVLEVDASGLVKEHPAALMAGARSSSFARQVSGLVSARCQRRFCDPARCE